MPRPVLRSLVFALITLIWISLTVSRFHSVQQANRGGSALEKAQTTVTEKVLLVTRATGIEQYRGVLQTQLGDRLNLVLTPWDELVKASPDDPALAVRYATALLLVGKSAEADGQLTRAVALKGGEKLAGVARALREAYGLVKAPLPPTRVEQDRAALEQFQEGWIRDESLASLYEKAGDRERARALRASVSALADSVAARLTALVYTLVGIFCTGVLVLLAWLIVGRRWNVRTTDLEVEPRFDPLAGWSMIVAWQVIAIAVSLFAYYGLGVTSRGPIDVAAIQIIVYGLLLVCVGVLVRGRWAEVGVHLHRQGVAVAMGLGGLCAAPVLLLAVQMLVYFVAGPARPSANPVFEFLRDANEALPLVALFVVIAILGPLLEEICFRGVVYGALRQVVPVWLAIPASAAVFSLAHADLNAAAPLFVLGSLLAYIYERTRSVVASWITHACWNGLVFSIFITLFT